MAFVKIGSPYRFPGLSLLLFCHSVRLVHWTAREVYLFQTKTFVSAEAKKCFDTFVACTVKTNVALRPPERGNSRKLSPAQQCFFLACFVCVSCITLFITTGRGVVKIHNPCRFPGLSVLIFLARILNSMMLLSVRHVFLNVNLSLTTKTFVA